MSQIQLHHKGARAQRKWHISQTILGALAFLAGLGGKAFCVSIEKDTLPKMRVLHYNLAIQLFEKIEV
ncbi:MAG: hypothetical protein OXT68_18595 [Chloroflexota bacterium]|nr:hypothetical protein [Chloroflexota bacterium]MDE2952764.1 hypothetical protein [Chloroflexota bacterium]